MHTHIHILLLRLTDPIIWSVSLNATIALLSLCFLPLQNIHIHQTYVHTCRARRESWAPTSWDRLFCKSNRARRSAGGPWARASSTRERESSLPLSRHFIEKKEQTATREGKTKKERERERERKGAKGMCVGEGRKKEYERPRGCWRLPGQRFWQSREAEPCLLAILHTMPTRTRVRVLATWRKKKRSVVATTGSEREKRERGNSL